MAWPITLHEALWAAGVFLLSLVASTAVVVSLLVLIRPDYFVRTQRSSAAAEPGGAGRRSPARRIFVGAAKNLVGVVLVLVGLLLSIPGVPGQGLLTILVGIMLIDLPHKRRFELRIVSRPLVRRTIDRVRARFGRPPILVEPRAEAQGDGPASPSPPAAT